MNVVSQQANDDVVSVKYACLASRLHALDARTARLEYEMTRSAMACTTPCFCSVVPKRMLPSAHLTTVSLNVLRCWSLSTRSGLLLLVGLSSLVVASMKLYSLGKNVSLYGLTTQF